MMSWYARSTIACAWSSRVMNAVYFAVCEMLE
jgi:hypothetical protein